LPLPVIRTVIIRHCDGEAEAISWRVMPVYLLIDCHLPTAERNDVSFSVIPSPKGEGISLRVKVLFYAKRLPRSPKARSQ